MLTWFLARRAGYQRRELRLNSGEKGYGDNALKMAEVIGRPVCSRPAGNGLCPLEESVFLGFLWEFRSIILSGLCNPGEQYTGLNSRITLSGNMSAIHRAGSLTCYI